MNNLPFIFFLPFFVFHFYTCFLWGCFSCLILFLRRLNHWRHSLDRPLSILPSRRVLSATKFSQFFFPIHILNLGLSASLRPITPCPITSLYSKPTNGNSLCPWPSAKPQKSPVLDGFLLPLRVMCGGRKWLKVSTWLHLHNLQFILRPVCRSSQIPHLIRFLSTGPITLHYICPICLSDGWPKLATSLLSLMPIGVLSFPRVFHP